MTEEERVREPGQDAVPDTRARPLLTDLVRHFMETFAREGRFNLHAKILAGVNDHHRVECLFKAVARSLSEATRINPLPGTAHVRRGDRIERVDQSRVHV